MEKRKEEYQARPDHLKERLRIKENFDVIARPIAIGGGDACLFFVDGFAKDDILEKILEFLMSLPPEEVDAVLTADAFASRFVTYVEVDIQDERQNPHTVVTQVLSGQIALMVEGLPQVLLIDARTYPVRSVEEPDTDRVLRGSHDGFVETLVFIRLSSAAGSARRSLPWTSSRWELSPRRMWWSAIWPIRWIRHFSTR